MMDKNAIAIAINKAQKGIDQYGGKSGTSIRKSEF